MKAFFASFNDRSDAESTIERITRSIGKKPSVRVLKNQGSVNRDSVPNASARWKKGLLYTALFGAVTGAIFAVILYTVFVGAFSFGAIGYAVLGMGAGAFYAGAAGAISGSVIKDQNVRAMREEQATGYTVVEIEVDEDKESALAEILGEEAHLVASP